MADENGAAAEATPEKSSSKMTKLIVLGIVVLASVIGGLATYLFVLAPMFSDEKPDPLIEEPQGDTIPQGTVAYDFAEAQATALSDDPTLSSSVLLYTVSMFCANQKTYAMVDANKQWFVALLSDLHSNKTKSELNDPLCKRSIEKQAVQEANSLLRRLQEEPDPEVRVIDVRHLKFAVFDL